MGYRKVTTRQPILFGLHLGYEPRVMGWSSVGVWQAGLLA